MTVDVVSAQGSVPVRGFQEVKFFAGFFTTQTPVLGKKIGALWCIWKLQNVFLCVVVFQSLEESVTNLEACGVGSGIVVKEEPPSLFVARGGTLHDDGTKMFHDGGEVGFQWHGGRFGDRARWFNIAESETNGRASTITAVRS